MCLCVPADVINIAIAEGVPQREGRYGVGELWANTTNRFVRQLQDEGDVDFMRAVTVRKVRRIVQEVISIVRDYLKKKPSTGTANTPPFGEGVMQAATLFIEQASAAPSKSATTLAREQRQAEEQEMIDAAMQSGRIAESVDDVPTPKKPKKNHRSKSIDDTQVFHRALDALLEDRKRAREQQER
ncbi:hypothetical protein PTSG_07518 [Salpingoeca rosetta]|uniref:Uncharacterized protein n=1 Tax=Salpingoeca rosetta (strain ATCC 50818 / BSB-021) TaxID=946362 RepID=F2UGZ9_SALR5|nr:uncharacterized protein PTSG_07518 [Salpingoeca rosetta]EGD76398.1 hypothetical protein PTSG_07518 [Salpingoeca rosetta]|eukprot:XP_004991313.1 hypothetical protein PTSG_07518 [Salpingoeca rosetta]